MKKTFTLIALSLFSIGANAQWDTLNTQTTTDFKSIAFSDNTNGVVVGYDATAQEGRIYHTTDGGQTWTLAHTGTTGNNDVCFSSATHGWAAADSGMIRRSIDAGASWGLTMIGTKDLLSVFFLTDSTGFIGGENGSLYRTTDGGAGWDTLDIQSTQPVRDIYFRNALEGWIVCDGGYIGHTIDGGNSWTAQLQYYGGFFQCKGIAFTEITANGFIVGNSGMMLSSIDAGLSWDTMSPVTSGNMNCIRFGNSLAGVMCGDDGRIYRTYAGGFNWADESMSYVTEKLNKVCFASDSVAYICGEDGRILKSNIDISSVQQPVNMTINAAAYPNPFESELHLVVNLENASPVRMTIMDISGRTVLEENFAGLNAGENILTPQGISTLTGGMYMVQLTTSNASATLPLIRK